MTSSTMTSSLDLLEIKPGVKFSVATLRDLLPDAETVLFFGKVYELDYRQLSLLMSKVLQSDLATALFSGDHSLDLQDYLVGYHEHETWCESLACNYDGECNCIPVWFDGIVPPAQRGDVVCSPDIPKGEILPEMWKQLEVEVAKSIKDVAAKLESVVGLLPGKSGKMVFSSMMQLNAKRPVIGDYKAQITHARQQENLLILDVSGSMNEATIATIVEDVVALSYQANAHLAIVSDTCTYWAPGSYDVEAVLAKAEYWGTHYETLAPVLGARDWGTVITVADYDSSPDAKRSLRENVYTRVGCVLDISLVNRPTFLAECVGQFADEVRPLLVGNSDYVVC